MEMGKMGGYGIGDDGFWTLLRVGFWLARYNRATMAIGLSW